MESKIQWAMIGDYKARWDAKKEFSLDEKIYSLQQKRKKSEQAKKKNDKTSGNCWRNLKTSLIVESVVLFRGEIKTKPAEELLTRPRLCGR